MTNKMAFANLFTRLAAVQQDVKSPGQPAFTHRNETENGKRANARKRKTQGGLTGPYKKKRCDQAQTTTTYNATSDDSKAIRYHMHNTDSQHASFGFIKEVMHSHSDEANHNNMYHKGQNSKSKNNHNVNKQQEQKKKTKKNQHHQKDRGRPAYRGALRKGGRDGKNKNDSQDFQVKRTRFMTQEFKDQNGLLVDGRLLCRHFLWGRCIKGDDCQLEHVQGYNDLVKEVCKFYVQGLCTKGPSCPYMHKSFPCKFFHRKGKCSQGADCRFSHDPLNDVTNQLLDEALKRESDLYELAKKAEQESSGQPANTDESETIEENRTTDIFMQPLRPNFYGSTDTNAEKEASLCQTEDLADNVEEAVPSHASDADQPHSSPSTNLNYKEPVCYSVEAVLGPQLSKPFISFFTPRSQESTPVSSSDCTSDTINQSQVPYSVDAVLRSCKSVENSTFGHTPTPLATQTVSYTPKTYCEEIPNPLLSSEIQNKKVLYSVNTRNETNEPQEKMFKSLSSLQLPTGLISKTSPNLTLASRDHMKQDETIPESLIPAAGASGEVQLELLHLPTDVTCSVNPKNEGTLPSGPMEHKSSFSRLPIQTSTSKHPTQVKPHLSVLSSDSQASFHSVCPSSGFTEFKGRATGPAEPVNSLMKSSDSENSVSCHFAAKQPTEIHQHATKTQSGLKCGIKQHCSTETTAESSSSKNCGVFAVGSKKTLTRPFHGLFASPVTDTLQPVDDSVTSSSCDQGLIQSSCPAPQPARYRNIHLQTALEPDTASASFLCLFAAPPSTAPLPCMQSQPDDSRTSSSFQQSVQSVDGASRLSDPNQRPSNLETPLPRQVRAEEISLAPRSPDFSLNAEIGKDSSTEHINQPTEQRLKPACSLLSHSLSAMSTSPTPCGDGPSTSHVHQQLPNISSHKGSTVAVTANSVLKTLFLCLSPYQQDGEQQDSVQISVPSDCISESEKMDKSSTGRPFVRQQQKSKKNGRRKKRLKTQDSHKQSTEKTDAHSREHQPSLQTPQISLDATGRSTLSSPGMTEPQVRDSGTHNLPFKPAVPLTQHHTRPRLKRTSEEGKRMNGNVAATPLKDLFKTLDTAVFHFGH